MAGSQGYLPQPSSKWSWRGRSCPPPAWASPQEQAGTPSLQQGGPFPRPGEIAGGRPGTKSSPTDRRQWTAGRGCAHAGPSGSRPASGPRDPNAQGSGQARPRGEGARSPLPPCGPPPTPSGLAAVRPRGPRTVSSQAEGSSRRAATTAAPPRKRHPRHLPRSFAGRGGRAACGRRLRLDAPPAASFGLRKRDSPANGGQGAAGDPSGWTLQLSLRAPTRVPRPSSMHRTKLVARAGVS